MPDESDAERTAVFEVPPRDDDKGRAYPTPGGTPPYPGWEGTSEDQPTTPGARPPVPLRGARGPHPVPLRGALHG
ncbi:hypothetical protein ACFSTC_01540 [Nonomuraea ferruginea]